MKNTSQNISLSDKNLRLTRCGLAINRPIFSSSHPIYQLGRAQKWAIASWARGNLKDCLYYLEDAEGYEFPSGTNTTQILINQLLEHKPN
jgi:hypothetical protein